VLDSFTISQDTDYIELYDVDWGQPGISLRTYQPLTSDQPAETEFRLYDPVSGERIAQVLFEGESYAMFNPAWIAEDYLFAPGLSAVSWLNWQTQEIEPITGNPAMVSLTNPDGARFIIAEQTWQLAFPGESRMDMGDSVDQIHPFGISRDGQWVAYGQWDSDGYNIIVQSNDERFEIGHYHNVDVIWGPIGWQVSPPE
jgi:hypothetical protein